jgi:hypothetical protein
LGANLIPPKFSAMVFLAVSITAAAIFKCVCWI